MCTMPLLFKNYLQKLQICWLDKLDSAFLGNWKMLIEMEWKEPKRTEKYNIIVRKNENWW